MALPFAALAAFLLVQQPGQAPSRGDSIVLRVLSTNDIHGHLEARPESWSNHRPVGGAATIAGMMNRLSAECGCPTIRLDAGDVMQGMPISNLTNGRSSVDAFNAMGYAAAAIGNHEFDWSVDTLAARIRQARFKWLASNIVFARTHLVPPWVTPWTIVQAGPWKVAVVGYATPGTTTTTNPRNVTMLGFGGPAMLDSTIGAVKASQHPDFTIVVAHEGAFCNRDTGCQGAIIDLATQLTNKPDLIVSGHTHSLITTTVAGIPIVQSRMNGTALGITDFVRTDSGRVARTPLVLDVYADREAPDTAVARIVAGYKPAVDAIASRPVATLFEPLKIDSGLADMVAEMLRTTAGADVGLTNKTGVRRNLDLPGPVTWGDLFEVLPFGNYVMKLTVTGAQLKAAIEHSFASGDASAAFAGMTVNADPSRPLNQRVVSITLADGRLVSDSAQYTLGTFDFLANGGSGYFMLRGVPSVNTGVMDLDGFIAWLERQPQPVRRLPTLSSAPRRRGA